MAHADVNYPTYPSGYSGTFYIRDLLQLARDVQEHDPVTYTAWGGDNSKFSASDQPYPVEYQPAGEAAQQADLKIVCGFILANVPVALQWQLDNQYGEQSESDPTPKGFRPFWTPQSDWLQCTQNMASGSGIDDVIAALRGGGYPDLAIADLICENLDDEFVQIQLNENDSNGILAILLDAPYAWRVHDPVMYFADPDTATDATQGVVAGTLLDPSNQLQNADCAFANHLGGSWVNFALPVPSSQLVNFGGLSYLNSLFWGFFQGASYIQPLGTSFLKLFNELVALGKALVAYCQAMSAQYGITYTIYDMISHVPLTPAQKKFLSQSKYYNPVSLVPPSFGATAIFETMAGLPALVASTDPRADVIVNAQEQPVASALAKNKEWFPAVLAAWARNIHIYLKNQPAGRDGMEESLLIPFADLYDPTGKN